MNDTSSAAPAAVALATVPLATVPLDIPQPPQPPATTLTFSNLPGWITYLGSVALFLVGLLTSAGVLLPSGVSGMIQAVTGGAVTVASVAVTLVGLVSHHSVQKAAIAAPHTIVQQPQTRLLQNLL